MQLCRCLDSLPTHPFRMKPNMSLRPSMVVDFSVCMTQKPYFSLLPQWLRLIFIRFRFITQTITHIHSSNALRNLYTWYTANTNILTQAITTSFHDVWRRLSLKLATDADPVLSIISVKCPIAFVLTPWTYFAAQNISDTQNDAMTLLADQFRARKCYLSI